MDNLEGHAGLHRANSAHRPLIPNSTGPLLPLAGFLSGRLRGIIPVAAAAAAGTEFMRSKCG